MARFSDDQHPAPYAHKKPTPRAQSKAPASDASKPAAEAPKAAAPAPEAPRRGKTGPVLGILGALVALAALAFLAYQFFVVQPASKKSEGSSSSTTVVEPGAAEGSQTSSASAPVDTFDPNAWEIMLVNYQHPIPEDWTVNPVEIRDGRSVDARIADQMLQMVNDCYAAGFDTIFINQGYRTHEDQQRIWDETYNSYLAQGYSADDAYWATAQGVAKPGFSEHECGLAADICSYNFDDEYNLPIQNWLSENGWKYGFVQRYPEGKEDITGVMTEKWHFRYVGVDAAKEMHDNNWTLEEYLRAHGVQV